MFFRQRLARDATLSYFFGCGGKGKAVAVDVVAGDERWFIDESRSLGVAITHVIDTHVHADHYSGGVSLASRSGAQYGLHESARQRAGMPFTPLLDEQTIELGNVRIRVVHTPGHTEDSVCLLVTDLRRGEAPWFLLTGDTLFVGAVGRPDLAGREREYADRLYDSLHRRILSLPDDIEIYPGHQAGSACGAGLSGKPSSTLGFEKRCNPMLSLNREAFVARLTQGLPPQPPEMAAILRFNVGLQG